MGKISKHVFRVMNTGSLAGWNKTVMGMQVSENAANKSWTAFYPGEGVKLVFQEVSSGPNYKSNRDSWYWKIGVTVSDVDLAREKIMASGTQVSVPNQFMEVGYLCHLTDPNGFTIEILQHAFKKKFVKPVPDPSLALAFTSDDPPYPEDINIVGNIEWLWQRPYTTLEIQCRPGQPCIPMQKDGEGVDHINMEVYDYEDTVLSIEDPDGVQLLIKKSNV